MIEAVLSEKGKTIHFKTERLLKNSGIQDVTSEWCALYNLKLFKKSQPSKIFILIYQFLTYNDNFANLFNRMNGLIRKHKQILFFALAGALSAIVEIGSFKIFSVSIPQIFPKESNFHGIFFPFSNMFSTTCGIVTNYFLSIWFVFERGKHSKKREFAYFMIVSFLSTLLSLLFFQIFYMFIFKIHLDFIYFTLSSEILSKVAAICVVSILNYSLKKRIIFNG